MTIFEHWQAQKDDLRRALDAQSDNGIYQIRHAISQAEQNALAEMDDDILRQQAGVLLGSIKQSVSLLEVQQSMRIQAPRSLAAQPEPNRMLPWAALAAQLLLCLWCGSEKLWFGLALAACALGLSTAFFLNERRRKAFGQSEDESRVVTRLDVDRLFTLLDGQMRAADRYLNDFSYLNDQLRTGAGESSDAAVVNRAADLLEALYDVSGDEREAAEDAAHRLLDGLGLRALSYSEEIRHYFNALPSKNVTRTLRPAIVSARDRTLLQRGTAAVRSGAA